VCVGRLWRRVIWGDRCGARLLRPAGVSGWVMAWGSSRGSPVDVQAAVFVGRITEECCSLPGSRCGPSPTFQFPSRGAFKSNKNPKPKTRVSAECTKSSTPLAGCGGVLAQSFDIRRLEKNHHYGGKIRATLPLLLFCQLAFQTLSSSFFLFS